MLLQIPASVERKAGAEAAGPGCENLAAEILERRSMRGSRRSFLLVQRFDGNAVLGYSLRVAEADMGARIVPTIIALLLAAGAFCGAGPAPAGINLFGVLFLFVAYVTWFEWEAIRGGYSHLGENGEGRQLALMFIRLGPILSRKSGRKGSNEEP
ncbi:MAG TPA: hypothetical protein VJ770_06215 [Stellaceae bacterium]|nr:hypothetical protein [Stellaceae bacterium]